MKICIISNLYAPFSRSGAGIYAEKIAKKFSNKHEVLIITIRDRRALNTQAEVRDKVKIYGISPLNIYSKLIDREIRFLPFKIIWHIVDLFNFHSYSMIKEIIKKENPDIVHTHNLGGLSAGATFRAVKKLSLPLVHTCHDYSILCPYPTLFCPFWKGDLCKHPRLLCKIFQGLKRKTLLNPDIVIAPSQFVLSRHISAGFFKKTKKIVLPLGVELSDTNLNKGKNNGNIVILYVGQLGKHKGAQVLINAFKPLKENNIKLYIIGVGKYESDLKELAKPDKRITFYGKVLNEEVKKFYNQADILVVPSIWYDNSPMVIYEALRQGVPVVGSNIGGIPELIKDNYNGFLFEAGNAGQLKKILANIIENPENLKVLSRNASESVKQYDMNRHVERLLEIYKEAIKLNLGKAYRR